MEKNNQELSKTTKTEPKGKQTSAPEIGTLSGQEAVAFSVGINVITTFYPVAFYEDLMRNRIAADSQEKSGNPQAFINQFSLVRQLRGPEYKVIPTPNNDTYYAQAYCEVIKEPLVLHIPAMEKERYYVMQLWDPYGNTFCYLGSRTIGSNGGNFVLVGPDYQDAIPKDISVIKAPFNNFVIWGRIGVLPIENDQAKIHKIQDELSLTYLSDFNAGKNVSPYNEEESTSRLKLTIPADLPQGLEWYYKITEALKHYPIQQQDSALLVSMEYIGIGADGKSFNYQKLTPQQVSGLKKGAQHAFYMMDVVAQTAGEEVNGWRWSPKSGILGNDYLFRAAWARWYAGGNSSEEAIYMDGRKDNTGTPFSPENKYVIHFDKDQLPSARAFWSISMYHVSDGSFVPNDINRYSIGNNTKGLQLSPDGSLEIYIQSHAPEDSGKKANWLPSPKNEGFYLNFRLYNPDNRLQEGTWKPPVVNRL